MSKPTAQISDKDFRILSTPDDGTGNFYSEHFVTIDQPLDKVFSVLGQGDGMEPVVRLSDICVDFSLLKDDSVRVPDGNPLAGARVRTLPAASSGEDGYPRQYFRLVEAVPLLFGLFKHHVEIVGTQTWDIQTNTVLYESVTSIGVRVRKLRRFEEIEEDGKAKTVVRERIDGKAPSLLKHIVQNETKRGHQAHMNQFHTLF